MLTNYFNKNNCFLTSAGSRNWFVKALVLGVGVGNEYRFISSLLFDSSKTKIYQHLL
jgi:hypothetical protein